VQWSVFGPIARAKNTGRKRRQFLDVPTSGGDRSGYLAATIHAPSVAGHADPSQVDVYLRRSWENGGVVGIDRYKNDRREQVDDLSRRSPSVSIRHQARGTPALWSMFLLPFVRSVCLLHCEARVPGDVPDQIRYRQTPAALHPHRGFRRHSGILFIAKPPPDSLRLRSHGPWVYPALTLVIIVVVDPHASAMDGVRPEHLGESVQREFLVSQGWLVASNLFNAREANRLYPILDMGMFWARLGR